MGGRGQRRTGQSKAASPTRHNKGKDRGGGWGGEGREGLVKVKQHHQPDTTKGKTGVGGGGERAEKDWSK